MARNTDRRARGNRARPSGQDPSARLGNGLAAQSGPASRAARTHPRTPRPRRNADPAHSAAATPARDHPQRSAIFTPWRPSPGGVMAWKIGGAETGPPAAMLLLAYWVECSRVTAGSRGRSRLVAGRRFVGRGRVWAGLRTTILRWPE